MICDAMAPRGLSARWCIQGIITLTTAMHVGGGHNDRVDSAILRDELTGQPILPGTSFAGGLRSALADHIGGFRSEESPLVAALFGVNRKIKGVEDEAERETQSACIVYDALGKLPENAGIEIRDGVAIAAKTGVAEDHKKFEFEVLPAGSTFTVRIDVLVPENPLVAEKQLLEALVWALDAFSQGEYALGARRSRGLGRVHAVWTAKRFALDTEEGWLKWVCSEHQPECSPKPESSIFAVVQKAAPPEMQLSLGNDQRIRTTIDIQVNIVNDVLVRSPGRDAGSADVMHLRSNDQPILPGTGLAGVLRAQAFRIAQLFHGANAAAMVDGIFGTRCAEGEPVRGTMQASRLHVGEAVIEDSQARLQTRIAIDRFTQSPVDGALFDEQVAAGGHACIQLSLHNPKKGEMGLMLLVVKDVLDGLLPIGGSASVGRGILNGTASVTWYEGSNSRPRTAQLTPRKPPSGEAANDVDTEIRAFAVASGDV